MRRFLVLFVLLPLAIVIVVVSVANRRDAVVSLDPFSPTPALSLTAPLFVFLFGALALGIVIGGVATWVRQGRWRRLARSERFAAERLAREVEQMRKAQAAAAPVAQLPARDAMNAAQEQAIASLRRAGSAL